MTKYSLIKELKAKKILSKAQRDKLSKQILKDEQLFQSLVEITFDYDTEVSVKASLILETVCEERLEWIAYNLSYFTENIADIKNESAIRPAAKICNLIAKEVNSKFDSPIKIITTQQQIDQMIETCFYWLMKGDTKVASKAHAMEALYHLGVQIPWIHYELKMIIAQNVANESPAYGTRATKILELMAKQNLA